MAELADATFTIVPLNGAVTMTVCCTLAPFARPGITGHVTMLPDSVPPFVAETKVTPAGSVSVTTTVVAVLGPLLVTVSV